MPICNQYNHIQLNALPLFYLRLFSKIYCSLPRMWYKQIVIAFPANLSKQIVSDASAKCAHYYIVCGVYHKSNAITMLMGLKLRAISIKTNKNRVNVEEVVTNVKRRILMMVAYFNVACRLSLVHVLVLAHGSCIKWGCNLYCKWANARITGQ